MKRLLLTFYGDDFTGSTDALEQLGVAGLRSVLFLDPPTPAAIRAFPGLQACGVAGLTRALSSAEMTAVLRPALKQLRALGARHVHYKVCSTFDSSPTTGSIGCVMELAAEVFRPKFIPLLVAAPQLGRYTVFGNHFARYAIGSSGAIHRLDRHPAISRHPVTPMTEADLAQHLSRQTARRVALFDVLQQGAGPRERRRAFRSLVRKKPGVILFDALTEEHLQNVGTLLDDGVGRAPLFSVGSSGVEHALALHWRKNGTIQAAARAPEKARRVSHVLVGSGSCSPVTADQILHAIAHGFAEVALNAAALVNPRQTAAESERAIRLALKHFQKHRAVLVHTTRTGGNHRLAARGTAQVLGTALGEILRRIAAEFPVPRLCVAGGDTSSYAARALGIQALELSARLTPGAPICRAHAPGSPVDGREVVFKGGQVGPEDYFTLLHHGIP